MEIVLNTSFGNPNLPVIVRPGFRDTFNRPNLNTLGDTDDGKPWQTLDPGTTSSVWGTFGDGTGGMKSSTSQHHAAVVDALTPDGTLTGVVSSYDGTSNKRFGFITRCTDINSDFIAVAPGDPNDSTLRILQRLNGTQTVIGGTTTRQLEAGDRLTVEMRGADIAVRVNSTEVLAATMDQSFTTATRHGLYAFRDAVAAWDYITFTPA